MAEVLGHDWPAYLRSLHPDDVRWLATWLADLGVYVGEFMEIVDRAWAAAPAPRRARPKAFIGEVGRPYVISYVARKRRFAALMATLEDAQLAGALPGDVAPQELDLPVSAEPAALRMEEVLAALDRVGHQP